MFIPGRVVDWFESLRRSADRQADLTEQLLTQLREELAAVRAERDALRLQAERDRSNIDWFKARVNQLELEKAAAFKKAFGIDLPVPEIVRRPPIDPASLSISFEDIGDEAARALGLEAYATPSS